MSVNSSFTITPKEFFYYIGPKDIKGDQAFKALDKIREAGLLDLLFFKPQIQEFARKRYTSKDALQESALNAADENGSDFLWIQALTKTYNIILKDPITAWMMNRYFPRLSEYIFTSLASSADYSNNGFGGSINDPLNDPVEMAKRLFKAFGTDENGDAIFKPAWTLINTAMRIESALESFPFRANIPPRPPDIFHLRLGAANFYVPPVTINVNSIFKTGSLTGGAIRQKNTPKFNAGYKETSVSIRLFFPNYEEIWGISIKDAANIDLSKDDFAIDFATDNEDKIDKFLSSLRGLVAAFKYSPIIPIKNQYLNSVHNITGVTLSSMNVATIPNFPFCLVVDLELQSFNHKPFLPMIKDFNQAVHWGKYRHYMGRAAQSLDSYINREFLTSEVDPNEKETEVPNLIETQDTQNSLPDTKSSGVDSYGSVNPTINDPLNTVLRTNIIRDWKDGNNISFFMPERVQSRIFTPDTSSFRSQQEKILNDIGRNFWGALLSKFGLDVNESAGYGRTLDSVVVTSADKTYSMSTKRKVRTALDLLLAGRSEDGANDKVYNYLATAYILNNPSVYTVPTEPEKGYTGAEYLLKLTDVAPSDSVKIFPLGGSTEEEDGTKFNLRYIRNYLQQQSYSSKGLLEKMVEDLVEERVQAEKIAKNPAAVAEVRAKIKDEVARAFNNTIYERFFMSGPIKDYIDAQQAKNNAYSFKEWEVPMVQVDLDPEKVIVDGVSVNLGNSLVKMQLQMQEEPTYQHVGGKDSYVSISMTVFGEDELIKIRNIFEHINGLARLEHAAGVIGFLGIKNIITSLCGIKYVLPLRYNVDTIPNFPHVYRVQLTLVDFDIFQQKREKLSSEQQAKFVEEFGTKKNPFLRIKQLWGSFNAYPDLPLEIYDKNGDVVGCFDPDYYFRSFEMFDRDVIVNDTLQKTAQVAVHENSSETGQTDQANKSLQDEKYIETVVEFLRRDDLEGLKVYFESNGISTSRAYKIVDATVAKYSSSLKKSLLLDFVDTLSVDEKVYLFTDTKFSVPMGEYKVGEITSGSADKLKEQLDAVFNQSASEESEFVSIDPDNLTSGVDGENYSYLHGLVYAIPASSDGFSMEIPGMIQTANGYNFGHISREDGRFYLKNNDFTVKKINKQALTNAEKIIEGKDADGNPKEYTQEEQDQAKAVKAQFGNGQPDKVDVVSFVKVSDTQTPDRALKKAHMNEIGTKAFAEYQYAYSNGGSEAESIGPSNGDQFSVTKHWEKMLIDTSYRDVSGRMVRAFPTYMLWLIDEGGFFAGVKLFDNFYGLQSIIDFSIVQSEDILGDTLIFRVSNMYSKLTRPEASEIYRLGSKAYDDVNNGSDELGPGENMSQGLERVVDVLLRRQDNIRKHMENRYVVDVENIRLKPGVRVHLRGGYGSNPNSLQTLFNGMITNVEQGEIMTITCQSDAIELSPIINSANKKGDSGKIDGGLNTGMFLSEPRDLMVKLLSMGTSRFREALKHSTRGTVFSENKFGIRHFGHILYEPLNELETQKNAGIKNAFKNAVDAASDDRLNVSSVLKAAWKQTGGSYNGVDVGIGLGSAALGALTGGPVGAVAAGTAGFAMRSPIVGHMRTLMSNLSTQRDYEIFKRNIYPGNGLGVSQFLGGDLDAGWSTAASMSDNPDLPTDRMAYIRRLGEAQWSKAVEKNTAEAEASASATGGLNNSSNITGAAQIVSGLGMVAGAGLLAAGMPVVGSAFLGAGLLGVTNGRAAGSVFETMGLLSSMDDDMPGFDEVSFRAQTYMRSVWDMFQLCARLLPNYIVAIRPFEDRSTVFYGKPHWLYTSGVMPVSTGFLNPDASLRKNVKDTGPQIGGPDQELIDILDKINKEASPMSDAIGFSRAFEPFEAAKEQAEKIYEGSGEFAPIAYIKDKYKKKLINFYDPRRAFWVEDGVVKARLPVIRGLTSVGLHLPFGDGSKTEIPLLDIEKTHKQIPQLPYRYQFPYFTDRKTGAFDGRHNGYVFNYSASDFFDINDAGELNHDKDNAKRFGSAAVTFRNLFFAELQALSTSGSGIVHVGDDWNVSGTYKLDSFQYTRSLLEEINPQAALDLSGAAFMDNSRSDTGQTTAAFYTIRMPYPPGSDDETITAANFTNEKEGQENFDATRYDTNTGFFAGKYRFREQDSEVQTYASFEFSADNITKVRSKNIYQEWGMPTTAEEEQFYIAMRWPYNPEFFKTDEQLKADFLSSYANADIGINSGFSNTDASKYLFGTAQDYKNRKVLVYNSKSNTAVCCKPAYFLWGNQKDAIANENRFDTGSAGDQENPFIDAVVSPDAAYYLGLLTNTNYEYSGSDKSTGIGTFGFDYLGVSNGDQASKIQKVTKSAGAIKQAAGLTVDFWKKEYASQFLGAQLMPISEFCYFTFVEDDFPLGVIPAPIIEPQQYDYSSDLDKKGKWLADKSFIIGFGRPKGDDANITKAIFENANDADKDIDFSDFQDDTDKAFREYGYLAEVLGDISVLKDNSAITTDLFVPVGGKEITFDTKEESMLRAAIGGNPVPNNNKFGYFASILSGKYDQISPDKLYEQLAKEVHTFKDDNDEDIGRHVFKDVFDPNGDYYVSTQARRNYDEDYDPSVAVIAGNGRTLAQAREIWDFFRIVFHDDKTVKDIFYDAYGVDPDDDTPLPEALLNMIINKADSGEEELFTRYTKDETQYRIENGREQSFTVEGDAREEFQTLLGERFINEGIAYETDPGIVGGERSGQKIGDPSKIKEAINFSAEKYLDLDTVRDPEGKVQRAGLFEDLDYVLKQKYGKLVGLLRFVIYPAGATATMNKVEEEMDPLAKSIAGFRDALGVNSTTDANAVLKKIDSPKKLYLILVGWFRQTLWSDPYMRAWVVLKPNRRLVHWSSNPLKYIPKGFSVGEKYDKSDGKWDFSPIFKAWQAFIDPNTDYAKNISKFKQFLSANAAEGDSATSWFSAAFDDTKDFWDRSIGVYFSAISDGLSGLLNMFKLSMAQMGYGLAEVDNLNKQANVLNKFLNDSIYYSLGDPGTLLRAVDNPFTREYGEPVVEIREPFQRIHYLSSFSHIMSNNIQENINDVATVVTAVSDGKYPVTVALDKGAPPERQTEKTVETGLYFDNIRGSGFFGVLHPLFHPFETLRGVSKLSQGAPDELTARRVALAHLKESIKDIYTGELVIVGNADIRPHDLVYLADVYERMYGIFEVEQVVHHFTPDLGFVTSITPNALVTVNDPARWFMTSWLNSWMSLQTIRNDTRLFLSSSNNSRTGIVTGGQVSIESLNEALAAQMMGGIQYTHGHSALVKDIMSNFSANAIPDARERLLKQAKDASGLNGSVNFAGALISTGFATITGAAAGIGLTFLTGGAAAPLLAFAGAGIAGAGIAGDMAWSGWKYIRDNTLDQHGCYVQYLTKNGQPMDAGLSYNQGMVVGKYHSKALLPGILGVGQRQLVRSQEGYAYIRTDDLLKNLGWQEKEIADLVRHISYENALVNAQVIKYSGIGPEKTGLNQFFKVLCYVTQFLDGDTFEVQDILRPGSAPFRVRFEGINAGELNKVSGYINNVGPNYESSYQGSWTDETSPGGRAAAYTREALVGRIFVLRVAPSKGMSAEIIPINDFDAGAKRNEPNNYLKDTTVNQTGFGEQVKGSYDRVLGTIFYRVTDNDINGIINFVKQVFVEKRADTTLVTKTVQDSIYSENLSNSGTQVVHRQFDILLKYLNNSTRDNYYNTVSSTEGISDLSQEKINLFNSLVEIKKLELLYVKASSWPLILWDEFYEDGSPATLNWELVTANLASVYTKNLLYNQDSVPLASESNYGRLIEYNGK